eukprot:1145768-Pelagomonas_calceolata.AAC.1
MSSSTEQTPFYNEKHVRQRKGKGCTAVPAYVGSLAGAKKVPAFKPVRSKGQERKLSQSISNMNFANPRTSA